MIIINQDCKYCSFLIVKLDFEFELCYFFFLSKLQTNEIIQPDTVFTD